jgi:tripartite-type tricarboxylate transporter receptor subunit TctC
MLLGSDFPTKPIKLEIGYPPGGVTDMTIRACATEASKVLGQPIICVNTPGSSGILVMGKIKNQKPDGYTLAGSPTANAYRIPHLREVPFKLEELTPICEFSQYGYGVAVRTESPWKTWEELVDYARKHPGEIKYSTAGSGTGQHLGMEYVAKKYGIQWSQVPFQGGVESIAAVLGGHVQATSQTTEFKEHVLAGRLRMLLAWNPKRLKSFPDVPTAKEKGIDVQVATGPAIWGPAGMPEDVITKIDDAFRKAAQTESFRQTCIKLDQPDDYYMGHQELLEFVNKQYKSIGDLVKSLNIGIYEIKKK